MIVGAIIIGIGAVSLVGHLGTTTINENYILNAGASTVYTIPAPKDTNQSMTLVGDAFNVKLESPSDGLQIPETQYKEELDLKWTHVENGDTRIYIQNTGNGELTITGNLIRSFDPIWLTYDFMVMISGVVIIGFSMGFTLRRPKGF